MAAITKKTRKQQLFLLLIFMMIQVFDVHGLEFQVRWTVPHSNDTNLMIYNTWASHNRFLPGDALRFRYKKDSVMQVTEAEYRNCSSTQPVFFSNTGDTVFSLRQPGPLYFISGVSGHCHRGLKMIVKVLAPPNYNNHHSSDSSSPAFAAASPPSSSSAHHVSGLHVAFILCIVAVSSFLSF